jgi:hydrogenase expression/formation protein HypE
VSTREQEALELIERVRARPPRFRDAQITMAHGAGGKATSTLIEGLIAPAFGLETLADAATVDGLALTTDSFVVKPLRFPGGSIGELAVNGTVNDLAVAGARPLALTLSLVLEEGLPAEDLRVEIEAIAAAAAVAGVRVVGGDTKVVERGRATRFSSPAVSASTASRSCWRAASSSSPPRSVPTPAHSGPPSTRCSRLQAHRCAASATRRAAGSHRC